jgi:hypothetical protein
MARRRIASAALPEWIRPQLTEFVDATYGWAPTVCTNQLCGYRTHARFEQARTDC